jgi:hypothetical protein
MILAMDSVAFYHLVTGIMILSATYCLDFFLKKIFSQYHPEIKHLLAT